MIDIQIIIVTHNNEKHIQWLLDGLKTSKNNIKVRIIDSGSNDKEYLYNINYEGNIEIEYLENIGFVAGNNHVLNKGLESDWTLLLNPDARVDGEILDELLERVNSRKDIGIATIPLIRYDIINKKPLKIIDSLGISCSKIGKWKDIGSGEHTDKKNFLTVESPAAVCGAFMLINNNALKECRNKDNEIGFESTYYMYKEDIELSLRLTKYGYKNLLIKDLHAYHCRGWNKKRSQVPFWAKLQSAKNDVDVAIRYKKRALPFAIFKLIWVNLFERFS